MSAGTPVTFPVIRKAQRVIGHHIVLRNATIDDAAFIVRLRTDPIKQRYISATSPEVAQQVAWLERYQHATDQAYFVVEDKRGDPVGTIRIYDPVDDSFCIGSWVMQAGTTVNHAAEALIVTYRYAFEVLGFNRSYFAVRHANRSVWRFMERFGAVRTSTTELDYCYESQREPLLAALNRYRHILPHPIQVIHDPVS